MLKVLRPKHARNSKEEKNVVELYHLFQITSFNRDFSAAD